MAGSGSMVPERVLTEIKYSPGKLVMRFSEMNPIRFELNWF